MTRDDLGPDCRVCRQPGCEALRSLWGCDADAPADVLTTTCPRCSGAGVGSGAGGNDDGCHDDGDDDVGLLVFEAARGRMPWEGVPGPSEAPDAPPGACALCGGRGDVSYRRCPTAVIAGDPEEGADEWVLRFRGAVVDLLELGSWPAHGPPGSQSAWLYEAVHLWMGERGRIERDRREEQERKAKNAGSRR